jgi:DinB superfamily
MEAMMKTKRLVIRGILPALALGLGMAQTLAAQNMGMKEESDPVSGALRQQLDRRSKNLSAAAKEMPADKYNFHPTPAQMKFATLVMHIAESNNFICSSIGGGEAPKAELKESDGKEKLVRALDDSFDFCSSTLAKVNDTRLGEEVPFFGGRKISRAAAMFALSNDWADHYSMAAMYLRLNKLLPPTAKPEESGDKKSQKKKR